VPFKFGCLSGLATISSLMLLLILAWVLVLIWMNNIDVSSDIRSVA
jgi:ABC-type siderophore export system fused ATPase/permease subunit